MQEILRFSSPRNIPLVHCTRHTVIVRYLRTVGRFWCRSQTAILETHSGHSSYVRTIRLWSKINKLNSIIPVVTLVMPLKPDAAPCLIFAAQTLLYRTFCTSNFDANSKKNTLVKKSAQTACRFACFITHTDRLRNRALANESAGDSFRTFSG